MELDMSLPGVSFLMADALGQCELELDVTPRFAERYQLRSPDSGSPKRNTKKVGDVSEAHVIAAFAERGYHVLLPFGENHRYDLVVDDGEHLFRVQVKTGRLCRNGTVIEYSCSSSHAHRGGASRPYFGEIDYLAVYCPGTQRVYLLPEQELTATRAHLRLSPPRNNMSKSIRWASRYELP